MTKVSNQSYIVLFLSFFAVSTTILLIASTAKGPLPAWGGYLDVSIVVLIAFTGMMIYQRKKTAPRYDISYQVATYMLPLIFVGLWVYRASFDFNILLPGVAWRAYFFLYILPHALTLWKSEQPQ